MQTAISSGAEYALILPTNRPVENQMRGPRKVPPRKKTKRPKTGKVTRLDKRLTQALNHPLRTEIIAILSDTCASPSEMADMLGEELSNVSYHTKQLLKLECIEVVDKKQVRGAVKTRYRA